MTPTTRALADGAIETPDDLTVVFHLNQPDQTFMQILTSATSSIVDEDTFPIDDKLADDDIENMVGSGPYKLSQYKAGEQAVFEANETYSGTKTPQSAQVFVQYFSDPAPLKTAVEGGDVDIAWRTLSPTDLNSIEEGGKAEVIRGKGSEFRYWVWQLSTEVGKDKAIRQAVAQLIDRQAISDNAYDSTVTPSYSIVPPGFGGQKDSFMDKYGEPDVDAAKQILDAAGVQTPVKIKLGYPPEHYGPNTVDEATELADQLNTSGLFEATTDDAAWEEYQTITKEGAYDLFVLGWYPDFLDADNYLSPFIRDGGFFANNYSNEEVNEPPRPGDRRDRRDCPQRADRSAPGHRRRGRPADPVVERSERRRGELVDDGCPRDAGPDVHLPFLDDQQGRLSHRHEPESEEGAAPRGAAPSSDAVDILGCPRTLRRTRA